MINNETIKAIRELPDDHQVKLMNDAGFYQATDLTTDDLKALADRLERAEATWSRLEESLCGDIDIKPMLWVERGITGWIFMQDGNGRISDHETLIGAVNAALDFGGKQ